MRQTIKTTIVLYGGAFFGMFNRLFLLPNYLSQDELGFLDNLVYISIIIMTVFTFGMYSIFGKFHEEFKQKKKYISLVSYVTLFSSLGLLAAILFTYFFKPYIISFYKEDYELINKYYYLFPILILSIGIRSLFSSYSTTEKSIVIPAILTEFWIKSTTCSLLIVLSYNLIQFSEYVNILIVFYILSTISLGFYCISKLNFKLHFGEQITKNEVKNIAKYSFFVFLAGFSGHITQFADSIMLGSIKGFSSSGIYSIAFFIGMAIELPTRALNAISFPIITSLFEKKQLKEINKLYKQSSVSQGFVGFLFFGLLVINIDSIFLILEHVYDSTDYSIGKNVALIIGFTKLLDMFLGINGSILRASKYYYYDLYYMFLLIVVVIGSNYILIPLYNLNGAAIATLISVALYNLIRYILVKRLFDFSPFDKNSLKLIIFSAILITLGVIFFNYSFDNVLSNIVLVTIKSLIFIILFVVIGIKLRISLEINSLINKILKKFLNFKL